MNGYTFTDDVNKLADMILLNKDEFLDSYPYLSEDDYYITLNDILRKIIPSDEIQAYKEWLLTEEYEDFASKLV